jgi:hypothetical protein
MGCFVVSVLILVVVTVRVATIVVFKATALPLSSG